MKKALYLSVLGIILAVCCGFSSSYLFVNTQSFLQTYAATDKNDDNSVTIVKKTATPDQAATDNSNFVVSAAKPIKIEQGKSNIIELASSDENQLLGWTSEKSSIVSVDSGGRIDALKTGKAVVYALTSDNRRIECEVTVVDSVKEDEPDIFSTSINANSERMIENICRDYEKRPFEIRVNRKMNCVTVYTYGDDGEYDIPVKAMVCSCGKNNGTITGQFGVYFKNEWHALYNGVYGHYVSGIEGDFLFHSVPYYTPASNKLEVEEYNKLGTSASLGCVRLAAADSKWIFDHCAIDTTVIIYDSDNPGPLGKPEAIRITDTSCGWDPTDDNPKNPYNKKKPSIIGIEDITILAGDSFSPLEGVKAYDTCSNDITDKIKLTGNLVTTREGKYKLTYSVTDALNRTCEKDIWITVKNPELNVTVPETNTNLR